MLLLINVVFIIWLWNILFFMETLYFFAPNMKGVGIFSASAINLARVYMPLLPLQNPIMLKITTVHQAEQLSSIVFLRQLNCLFHSKSHQLFQTEE